MVTNTCNDSTLLPILSVVKRVMTMVQIMVPLILIVMVSIKLINMIMKPDEKKEIKKIINTFIVAVVVFFVPVVVDVTISMLGENNKFSNCWLNADESFSVSKKYFHIGEKERKSILQNPDDYEPGVPRKSSSNTSLGSSSVTCLAKEKNNKVLFYGNSKTVGPNGGEVIRDNNVAVKFEGIAKSKGYDVTVVTIDEGLGSQHGRLNDYYDCYVDQQCTDCMSNADGVASAISSRANTLRNSNPNVGIYLRQIWTYCSGGQINDDDGLRIAFEGAVKASEIAGVSIIPDGKALLANKNVNTGINVCDDDRHQNNKGAYLVGATVFKFLSGESPVGATYYDDLDSGTANTLLNLVN